MITFHNFFYYLVVNAHSCDADCVKGDESFHGPRPILNGEVPAVLGVARRLKGLATNAISLCLSFIQKLAVRPWNIHEPLYHHGTLLFKRP